jgi:hypothetical protein
MEQTYCLDKVIQRVDKSTQTSSPSRKVVQVDREAGPRRRWFGRDLKYFLVSNTLDNRNVAECDGPVCYVKHFATGRNIGIRVKYEAKCKPGNEERVARALGNGIHPGAALDEFISKWVIDFTTDASLDFIDNYYSQEPELRKYLAKCADGEVGLTLQFKLMLEGERSLAPIELSSELFPVQVSDYPGEQNLKLTGRLQVEEEHKINAIVYSNRRHDLDRRIREHLREYFADKVSLQQFCDDLNKEAFRRGLEAFLNTWLKLEGRRIRIIALESESRDELKKRISEFNRFERDVQCTIREYPAPVSIKNSLQMILVDSARTDTANPIDLEAWVGKNLEEVIHSLLFDKRYLDLLLNFDETKDEIRRDMQVRASEIGYDIRQLITQPDLKPFKLLDNFTIDAERSFATRIQNFPVKLNIVVVARIENLSDVEKHLNRQEDVQEAIEECAVEEARQYLHSIDPADFYMKFSDPGDSDEQTIEETLIEKIKAKLAAEFKAQIVKVVPKVVDTEIVERLKKLRSEVRQFSVFVQPFQSSDRVVFEGSFQVDGVVEWYTFQLRQYDLNQILDQVERNVRSYLATRDYDELRWTDPDDLDATRLEVQRRVNQNLQRAFGVAIGITSFTRNRTDYEEAYARADRENTLNAIETVNDSIDSVRRIRLAHKEQLDILLGRYNEVVANGDANELEELNNKINAVSQQLSALDKASIRRQLRDTRRQLLPAPGQRDQIEAQPSSSPGTDNGASAPTRDVTEVNADGDID